MTTAYTDLLGLALPVQGELDGSWGDTINNAITSLVEDAVAGTTTLSSDADVTLTTTEGDSNEARAAIINWTASGTTTRTITAPAQSKVYVLINGSGTQSIKLVGAGPTTGITAVAGEKCIAAWNGSDFVKVASSVADGVTSVGGTGTVNGLTLSGTVTSTGSITLGGTLSGVNLASAVTGTLPVANGGTGVATLTGLAKGNGTSAFSAAVAGTDYAPATSGTAILKGNGSGGFSSAASGTDYAPATSGTAILKGNGSGGFSNAASGTDYAPATSGTALLKGNGSGGFSNAASGTDYAPATSGSSVLYGNGSGGFSNVTIGSGLQFTAGTLSTDGTAGLGTVTSVGVSVPAFLSVSGSPVTSSGTIALSYSGTALPVANGGTGATTLTGLVKGTGTTAFTAAVSGTDYAPATSGSAILKGDGAGGFSSAASGTDYAPATSGSSILKGNGSGGFSSATSGTDYAPATSGNAILKGDSSGGFAAAVSGTDYAPATSGSNILYGDGSGGFSGVTVGTGLSFTGGTLSTTSTAGGTVTSIDISGGTTGLTTSGGPVTDSGTITLAGTLAVSNGGTGATTLTGILKGTGTTAVTTVTAPTGALVGTSDTQTLTNKTLSVDDNTVSGFATSSFVLSNASGYLDGAAGQKTIPSGVVVGTTDPQTLTNKIISVDNNTVSGIAASSFVLSDTSGYLDGSAAQKAIPSGDVVGTTDSQTLTNKTISATGNTISGLPATSFAYTNGSGGLDGTGSAKAIPNGVVVGTTDTQTLTNKTLDGVSLDGSVAVETYTLTGSTVNPTNGTIQTLSLSANTAITISLADGESVFLMATQNGYTLSYSTTVVWVTAAGNTAPTLSGSDALLFWAVGSTVYGSYAGSFA